MNFTNTDRVWKEVYRQMYWQLNDYAYDQMFWLVYEQVNDQVFDKVSDQINPIQNKIKQEINK